MSDVIHGGIGLEAALTSDNVVTRVFARLAASGAGDEIVRWYNAERDRGTGPIELLYVLSKFAVNMHASFAGQELVENALEPVMHAFKNMVENEYPACFAEAQRYHEARMNEAQAGSAKPQGQTAVADGSAPRPEGLQPVRTQL